MTPADSSSSPTDRPPRSASDDAPGRADQPADSSTQEARTRELTAQPDSTAAALADRPGQQYSDSRSASPAQDQLAGEAYGESSGTDLSMLPQSGQGEYSTLSDRPPQPGEMKPEGTAEPRLGKDDEPGTAAAKAVGRDGDRPDVTDEEPADAQSPMAAGTDQPRDDGRAADSAKQTRLDHPDQPGTLEPGYSTLQDRPGRVVPHTDFGARSVTAGSDQSGVTSQPSSGETRAALAPEPVAGDQAMLPASDVADTMELSPKLDRIYTDSTATAAGRCYYGVDDTTMRAAAQRVLPDNDRYTVDAHGDPDSLVVGPETLDAGEISSLVRADPAWEGRPVRLMACETGQGDDPVAQRVADELSVPVLAPTELAWSDANGQVWSASGYVDEYGLLCSTEPPDGQWLEFRPGQSPVEVPNCNFRER